MNKKTWLLIAIVFAIWICLFPFVVFADSATYTVLTEECMLMFDQGTRHRYAKLFTGSDVRITLLHKNDEYKLWFVSLNSFSFGDVSRSATSTSTCPATANNTASLENGYYRFSYVPTDVLNSNIPIVELSSTEYNNLSSAIYYTFGDGALGPTPTPEPINWGILRGIYYTTRIAGSGQTARRNIDYISWENNVDANGNDISDCQVEIQAVYGKFTGNTLNDLWETDIQDLVILGSVSLATVSASLGTYSVSWQKVIDDLNSFEFDSLFAHEVSQQIEKNGWYYQIRLLGTDGYIGSWQNLYTPLSLGAKASETVITQNNFDMSVYQVYQDLSTINNNTSITITYIDTDYIVNNPSDGTEPEGGTNLWDVLKELINGVFQILAKLGDIVISLIDGLLDLFRQLFTPPDSIDNSINETFELNINNYVEENQNDLHQLNLHMKQFETDMKSLANQYGQGNISSCVLTWEDVTIDLSLFSAGNVTLIQGGTYNFGDLFGSMINAFDISYEQYQFFVSGVIYICLIVFINKKIVWFLHNS